MKTQRNLVRGASRSDSRVQRIVAPRVSFSTWTRWTERYSLPQIDQPGVYLLARFRGVPPEAADPLDEAVIYIGESTDRTIQNRFYEFHRSAFEAKFGHSAGWTYASCFEDKGVRLFVAVFPVIVEDPVVRSNFIRYIERKLIWDYVRRWRRPPRCNTK